jgi:unsaturated rhamnogalacturonyl hydrolase
MKKLRLLPVLFVVISALTFPGFAQKLPEKKGLLQVMAKMNNYFMQKWPDPGKDIMTNRLRPSNIWTRAVYYEGVIDYYKVSKDKAALDYAVLWGEKHKWGLRDGPGTRNADNQCCGQTYLDLYLMDPKPERLHDIKLSIDSMVMNPKNDAWSWVDALQMAMPVFARLGVIEKKNIYYERMFDMYDFTKTKHGTNGLYNPAEGLWWRDKDFVPPYKEPNGDDCYWSRGNGWAIAALVRVLDVMPSSAPHREVYLKDFLDMAKALRPLQRKDGFWNVSLNDSTNYGGKEVSGTALFIYGMAWGVNKGLLSKKEYQPVIIKAWNSIIKDALRPDGSLGFVQGTGKEPKDGQPVTFNSTPDFEDYGLGCVLLAGSEIYKMK